MSKIVAGIPTCRPELCLKAADAWYKTEQFDEIWIWIDAPKTPDSLTRMPDQIFTWEGDPECIPKHTGCGRSRLVWEAWKDPDVEWLIHLDDDVLPYDGHWVREMEFPIRVTRWQNTMDGVYKYPRGHPYSERQPRVSATKPRIIHGMWHGDADLDAVTELCYGRGGYCHRRHDYAHVIPNGQYFAMSSMAVAIHRDLFPASYFMWMGTSKIVPELDFYGYGDIWCGVILKKICDHFNWPVVSGHPLVEHKRASDTWAALRAQVTTMEDNEHFWKWIDEVNLEGCGTVTQCYRRIAATMCMPVAPKFKQLREMMLKWGALFQE